MLRSVLENFVDTLSEREFDIPLLCLLLNDGFHDIHYLHGNFEFGKDFIAKKVKDGTPVQYVFQSKAGDIDLRGWRELKTQVDEMRTNYLAHPNYDKTLPLATVAVVTGRFVGGAALSAQEYNDRCRECGEVGFEVWDKDRLIEMILATDPTLSGLSSGGSPFLQIVGTIRNDGGNFIEIERYSRGWVGRCIADVSLKTSLEILLESSLVCHELLAKGRLTLAAFMPLMALRAVMAGIHSIGVMPGWVVALLRLIEDQFLYLTNTIQSQLTPFRPDINFWEQRVGCKGFVSYPVLCHQLIEILGLKALLHQNRNEPENAKGTAGYIEEIINCNPGCCHPISDNYAASLIPPILALAQVDRLEPCEYLLRETCKWLCDRYEASEVGLAAPHSDSREEIERLLGYAYEFVNLSNRRSSNLATVLLDLSVVLGRDDLYSILVNDVAATNISPSLVVMKDNLDQYIVEGSSPYCPNIHYEEKLSKTDGFVAAMHHSEPVGFFFRQGFSWASLALSSVLRDRHKVSEMVALLNSVKENRGTP